MALPLMVSRKSLRHGMFGIVLPIMTSALGAQQPQTDGVVTSSSVGNTRAAVTSPPLPPDSTELAYDTGVYTGSARNLQNAGIHPGWGYWAQAVRFTPTGAATGTLLEVRYVASTQWGSDRDFDVVVRDDQGNVLGILQDQTATLDTSTWQIVDMSSLGLQVGTSDFTVELRPADPCNGATGFAIAYSTPDQGRFSASVDCTDAFLSFQPEARDLFLRAVVENTPSPSLSLGPLVAGQPATLQASGLTPSQRSWVGLSLVGAGPWASPIGLVSLTPPVRTFPLDADAQGNAALPFQVPAGMGGAPLWLQVHDPTAGLLGPGLAAQVQ